MRNLGIFYAYLTLYMIFISSKYSTELNICKPYATDLDIKQYVQHGKDVFDEAGTKVLVTVGAQTLKTVATKFNFHDHFGHLLAATDDQSLMHN